jgi:hypothetical protein
MTRHTAAADLHSRKGIAHVAYDQRIWIPAPPTFPLGMDREAWAAGYADAFWEMSGLRYGQREIALLREDLELIHKDLFADPQCHMAYIHLPDPRLLPLAVGVGVWPAAGCRDERLRLWTHADDPDAVSVRAFPTTALGSGLKVAGTGGFICYAWRCDSCETDVTLHTACPYPDRLDLARDDIDALAHRISVTART